MAAVTLVAAAVASPGSLHAQPRIKHDMDIRLQPTNNQIAVEDKITLPDTVMSASGGAVDFVLHAGLEPVSATAGVTIVRQASGAQGPRSPAGVPLEHYRASLPAGTRAFALKYAGTIHHPLLAQGEDYARSFQETPGTISAEGVYLAGATYWYPQFTDDLVTFTVDVRLPPGWQAVSQGTRTLHVEERPWRRTRWESSAPQEEIYLIAGKFSEYGATAGAVKSLVYLRSADAGLAKKYLDATARYIDMYSKLIGPYPYDKFALVENFWETGYGMPSFTLLGPKVIRFPFILHSSYPHEILHNWWGNGVFVDYESGNWSEGLTAYLADHLIQEQRGTAVAHRRTALQRYADYVTTAKDFPLSDFRMRHSAVTQAVGYDKALMFFHLLRLQLGDATFIRGLQAYYRDHKFRRASYADLRRAFEAVSGQDLRTEFMQWISRAGAPALRVARVTARPDGEEYLLSATLEQVQAGDAYRLRVPVAVHLQGREAAHQATAVMDSKRLELALRTPVRPLRLDVDPQFDVFRRLDRNEIPPALSQAFGADRALIVLPSAASAAVRRGYRQLAESWQKGQAGQLEIALDAEIDALPADRAVWLFGWENRFRDSMTAALAGYDVAIGDTGARIGDKDFMRDDHSLVVNARAPANAAAALTWLASDKVAAMSGLARKLPHYGKYSYLAFEGDEPVNVAKGQWPVVGSPMSVVLSPADAVAAAKAQGKLAPRRALIYPPATFSQERMLGDIRWLAGDELRGRGFGTPELDEVAEFLAAEFRRAGLLPGGDRADSYFQTWTARGGEPQRQAALRNVVGILPGGNPQWAGQSVVLGAHYDHLGLGWPDVHKQDEGKIHPGADDNASGVAVLLELARAFAREGRPDRTLVFVAFAGEEAGRRGSKYYVAQPTRFPATKIMAMLNIDTVGRLAQKKLMVLGAGSAREWTHIFRGVGYVTGVAIEPVADDFGASDQKSFLDAGIPAVQFFSGPHPDYHRPGDTSDKIDARGLVSTAAVIKETVDYLAGRAEPLSSALRPRAGEPAVAEPGTPSTRQVSLGTIPDFAYRGKGVRLSGVMPGSPVERAGLRAGDIIVGVQTTAVSDLRGFSDLLKQLRPGDSVTITFERNGQRQRRTLKAVSR